MFAFQKDDIVDVLYITKTHRGSRKMSIINDLPISAATHRDDLTWNNKTTRAPCPLGQVEAPNEFLPVYGENASGFQSVLGFGVADNGV